MYGGTRARDYQIVEADQYRGVQVWGLYHVGADFSIVENKSEHCERQWNATALAIHSLAGQWGGERGRKREDGKIGREGGWKSGRGQEGGVWGGWVRGLSGSLSESQITRIKGLRGRGEVWCVRSAWKSASLSGVIGWEICHRHKQKSVDAMG